MNIDCGGHAKDQEKEEGIAGYFIEAYHCCLCCALSEQDETLAAVPRLWAKANCSIACRIENANLTIIHYYSKPVRWGESMLRLRSVSS